MATVIILRGRIPAKAKDASPPSWKCTARSVFSWLSKELKVIINALHQVAPFRGTLPSTRTPTTFQSTGKLGGFNCARDTGTVSLRRTVTHAIP